MIPKGTLVCRSEPFAYVVAHDCKGYYCDYCLKPGSKLRKCRKCHFMSYCDKNCHKNALKEHKRECVNLKSLLPAKVPSDYLMLTSRIIYKLKFDAGNDEEEKVGSVTRRFKDLESHVENIKTDATRFENFKKTEQMLKDFLPPADLPPYDELLEIFGKCQINGEVIRNDDRCIIGAAVYLGTSIFDHSCRPNARLVSDGIATCVYLIEDIPDLDHSKIFVPYIYVQSSTENRRKELKQTYYFDCNCAKCLDVHDDQLLSSIKCANSNCDAAVIITTDGPTSCAQCGEKINDEYIKKAKCAMESCEKALPSLHGVMRFQGPRLALMQCEMILEAVAPVLHWNNIHYFRLNNLAYGVCMTLGQVRRALELAELVLEFRKQTEGSAYCPRIGSLLLRMAKLAESLKDFAKARDYLTEGLAVIDVTHGLSEKMLIPYRQMLGKLDSTRKR